MRGKRALLSLGISLVACGTPKLPPPPPPPPVATVEAPAPSYTYAPPTGPVEDAKKSLAAAASEKDPHERCRLLNEAATLDPTSLEARRSRAGSRCAQASELLADARAVFAASKDVESAKLLRDVATRAEDTTSMKEAAETFVAQKDFYDAAALYVALGDHARAAAAFDELAAHRSSKGASVDAFDARLSAEIERARSKKPTVATLDGLLGSALEMKKSYGAAWVGPKFLEALAAARNAGDDTSALAAKANKKGLFVGAEDAFAIERAIATKTDATALVLRVRSRLDEPAVRALLAVHSKSCPEKKAHARAHSYLGEAAMRLDDDVLAVLHACVDATSRTTMVPVKESADVADAIAIVDPPRKRARVLAIAKARPDDVSAAAWAMVIADHTPPTSMENEPTIQDALLVRNTATSMGKPSAARARAYVKALQGTVEAEIPRAIAPRIAQTLELARMLTVDTKPGWEEVATALLKDCAAGLAGPCLTSESEAPILRRATELLRGLRPFVLAAHGAKLSKADFADPRVRLDVIFGLVTWDKQLQRANLLRGPGYGAFPNPEGALANALVSAAVSNCAVARGLLKEASPLSAEYADAWAWIEKTCM